MSKMVPRLQMSTNTRNQPFAALARRLAGRVLAGLALVGLLAAACGSDSSDDQVSVAVSAAPAAAPDASAGSPAGTQGPSSQTPADTPSDAPDAQPEIAYNSLLPSVDVVRIATGESVNLASLAPADRPMVLWFWAPH